MTYIFAHPEILHQQWVEIIWMACVEYNLTSTTDTCSSCSHNKESKSDSKHHFHNLTFSIVVTEGNTPIFAPPPSLRRIKQDEHEVTIGEGWEESEQRAEDPGTDGLESAKLEKLIEGICLLFSTRVRHFHDVSRISLDNNWSDSHQWEEVFTLEITQNKSKHKRFIYTDCTFLCTSLFIYKGQVDTT